VPEQLLTIFTVCFLALLYLFFVRVLRVMWTSVSPQESQPRSSRPRKEKKQRSQPAQVPAATIPTTLVFNEPAELSGRQETLLHGMTMGRGPDNTVVLNDSFLSTAHGRFEQGADGRWYLIDVGSTNGTFLNGTRIEGTVPLQPGDVIQLGNVVMDVQ
jgi:pSer/pThr/pTyr-binding forkhead associated (FHA) protein